MLTVAIACAQQPAPTSHASPLDRVEFLEKRGHHDEARVALSNEFQDKDDPVLLGQWIDLDKEWLSALKADCRNTEVAKFTPQQSTIESTCGKTGGWAATIISGYFTGVGNQALSEWERRELVRKEEANPLPEIDIEKAARVIKDLDGLRTSQDKLAMLIKRALTEDKSIEKLREFDALNRQLAALASDVLRTRRSFFSYDVISPNLARSEQLIHLADLKAPIFGHDKDILAKSARVMTRACVKESLFDADECVRDQFLRVFKLLKGMAGKEELDELKMLQTLSDSIVSKNLSPAHPSKE